MQTSVREGKGEITVVEAGQDWQIYRHFMLAYNLENFYFIDERTEIKNECDLGKIVQLLQFLEKRQHIKQVFLILDLPVERTGWPMTFNANETSTRLGTQKKLLALAWRKITNDYQSNP